MFRRQISGDNENFEKHSAEASEATKLKENIADNIEHGNGETTVDNGNPASCLTKAKGSGVENIGKELKNEANEIIAKCYNNLAACILNGLFTVSFQLQYA